MENNAETMCRSMLHRTESRQSRLPLLQLDFVGFNPIVHSALFFYYYQGQSLTNVFASCNPYFTDGQCEWLYQTVGQFSLPTPNSLYDVNVICGNPNRRQLKGGSTKGPTVYNHEVFADHYGRVFSDDAEACLDINLSNGNVIMTECHSALPLRQTWIVV